MPDYQKLYEERKNRVETAVHGGQPDRVPNVLLSYLGTIQGGGAQAVPMVTYGNRAFDDALIELRDLLEADGFHTVAAAAMIGEHSFSTTLAKGRPDAQDLAFAEAFADKVAKAVEEGSVTTPVQVPGVPYPYRGYYIPKDREGRSVDIRKVKPQVSSACTRCMVCVGLCPMGSISREDVTAYTGICIKCGACIKGCPENARYYVDKGYLYHKKELEEMFERRAEPESIP